MPIRFLLIFIHGDEVQLCKRFHAGVCLEQAAISSFATRLDDVHCLVCLLSFCAWNREPRSSYANRLDVRCSFSFAWHHVYIHNTGLQVMCVRCMETKY